jgi:dienelactone hydrolase
MQIKECAESITFGYNADDLIWDLRAGYLPMAISTKTEMSPYRWRRIEQLYHAALERASGQRAAFLRDACLGDDALRHEVESLLAQENSTDNLLERPVSEAAANIFGEPQNAPLVGHQMGHYQFTSLLGVGGMGEVYQAADTRLDRVVAIKVLPERFAGNPERLARFWQEAKLLAALNHPNIAAIYGLEQSANIHFLVMELVPGETLADRIRRGPIPIPQALRIAGQIAGALAAAHGGDRCIIHRDLKPGNVKVTPQGQVKVLDFGLAKDFNVQAGTANDSHAPKLSVLPTVLGAIMGTPAYMSPEQARGGPVDKATDIWAFGCVLYEMLTGKQAFGGQSTQDQMAAVLTSEVDLQALPDSTPPRIRDLLRQCLQKHARQRPQDFSIVKAEIDRGLIPRAALGPRYAATAMACLVLLIVVGGWFYRRTERRIWVREQAIPEIAKLSGEKEPLAAFLVLHQAEQYLPGDTQLAQIDRNLLRTISVQSAPAGAKVEIQDYSTPKEGAWFSLGTTPLNHIRVPKGYFRWRLSAQGAEAFVSAPVTRDAMQFSLPGERAGMVSVPGGDWHDWIGFIGLLHYVLPAFDLDRFEVTNREYQQFVDQGGYQKREEWKEPFVKDGKQLSWEQAADLLRDPTGRPGPSTWEGGHFPAGQADYPVSGVSWYEAAAYCAYAGKTLPSIGQWYKTAPVAAAEFSIGESNFGGKGPMPVGVSGAVGPYGTYDMTGNVQEWVLNALGEDRFILGGGWRTQTYEAYEPQALPPLDRSAMNGFRCVLNKEPLLTEAAAPIAKQARDFSKVKPISDDVFQAYETMYAYDQRPLNPQMERAADETPDWTKQRITIDAGYENERLPAYLFLPKNVRPPFEAVVFFPSARVNNLPDSHDLGDMQFIDYVIQSGRALIYPIYAGTYERNHRGPLPGDNEGQRSLLDGLQMSIRQSKEVRRSVDYLETRPDIDKSKLAYLGVSQGSAYGVIYTTLEDRFKAVVFLDGGFFQGIPLPARDQANFAPRLQKPLLMVNGQYDILFSPALSQLPLVKMIGTLEADKRRVVFPTQHDVSQDSASLSKEVLAWLDKYLGKVN